MAELRSLLEPNKFYHIYNHAVGKDNLFNSSDNFSFFLKKMKLFLENYINVYAYCLMPNHFHFVIQVKERRVILDEYRKKANFKESNINELDFISMFLSRQFGNLFNSYAQAYNKVNRRMGSLFTNRFKRQVIEDEEYLKTIIVYTHNNPVKAKMVKTAKDWKFSSYNSILSSKDNFVKRNEVIELFDDVENFIYCHFNK